MRDDCIEWKKPSLHSSWEETEGSGEREVNKESDLRGRGGIRLTTAFATKSTYTPIFRFHLRQPRAGPSALVLSSTAS